MTRTIFIAAALALAVTLPAVPAQAQSNHTFVSAAGSDSNNCASVTTPCRHFANAYAVTNPNGEIFVLDPANYGAFTITGPVSIEGHGWASFAAVSGQAAITINANPGDKINIIGVVLDGVNITNSTGIRFSSGGTLTVRDSVLRNFTGDGIFFAPNTSNQSQLFVSNTLLSDNGVHGIDIDTEGSGTTKIVLNHVELENNVQKGLSIISSGTQTINVTVSDSVIASNGGGGIYADTAAGVISVMVRNSTIANNTTGLDAEGPSCSGGAGGVLPSSTIRITRSTITGNSGNAWSHSPTCGFVISYSDNNIDGNGNDTAPSNSLPYK